MLTSHEPDRQKLMRMLNDAERENSKLRALLSPFAEACEDFSDQYQDHGMVTDGTCRLTIGDLRAARKELGYDKNS